jgi:hypothetical protein
LNDVREQENDERELVPLDLEEYTDPVRKVYAPGMPLYLTVEWPNNPEEVQFLRTQYNVDHNQKEAGDKDELQIKTNARRYSFFKEKLTSMIIIFIIIGILAISINLLIETGSWRPATLENALFDIFVIVEIVIILLLFYLCFIMYATYTSVTIYAKHVALYGFPYPKFTFDDVSFFEVLPPKHERENKSNPVNHIISIHLKSGKRIRLRTPPSFFFNSCRTAMELDLLNTIKAPKRISNTDK